MHCSVSSWQETCAIPQTELGEAFHLLSICLFRLMSVTAAVCTRALIVCQGERLISLPTCMFIDWILQKWEETSTAYFMGPFCFEMHQCVCDNTLLKTARWQHFVSITDKYPVQCMCLYCHLVLTFMFCFIIKHITSATAASLCFTPSPHRQILER